jgi:hypothetical protein
MKRVIALIVLLFAVTINAQQVQVVINDTVGNGATTTGYLTLPTDGRVDSIYFAAYHYGATSTDSAFIFAGTTNPKRAFRATATENMGATLVTTGTNVGYVIWGGVLKGTELAGVRTFRVGVRGASSGNTTASNKVVVTAFIYVTK